MKRGYLVLLVVLLSTGLIAGCSLLASEPEPTETPIPTEVGKPEVSIVAPPSGAEAPAGSEMFVQSNSSDAIGVVRVELQVNGAPVRNDTTPEGTPQVQFALLQGWTPDQPGQYTLSVIAYREDGTPSDPASIMINVTEAVAAEEPGADETPAPCIATASTALNVRSGPGINFGTLGGLALGQQATVTGRNADDSWLAIDFNNSVGWVSAPFVYREGSCGALAVLSPSTAGSGASTGHTPTYTPGGPTATYTYTPDGSPTVTYTPGGPTPTYTYTPDGSPTATATYTYTPGGPTPTYTYTPTHTYTPTYTHTPTYTFTPSSTP